jgi:hypothetical protein
MELDRESPPIRASLVQGKNDILTQVIETPGNTVVVGTPRPIGTPGPLEKARGPRYEGQARAQLDAAQFEKDPEVQPLQRLDSPILDWSWSITPKSQGKHTVIVSIQIEWTPADAAGQPIIDRIFSHNLEIEVTKPFLSYGELQIGTLLTGFLGSVLSAPFFYQIWKELKEKRKPPEDGLD